MPALALGVRSLLLSGRPTIRRRIGALLTGEVPSRRRGIAGVARMRRGSRARCQQCLGNLQITRGRDLHVVGIAVHEEYRPSSRLDQRCVIGRLRSAPVRTAQGRGPEGLRCLDGAQAGPVQRAVVGVANGVGHGHGRYGPVGALGDRGRDSAEERSGGQGSRRVVDHDHVGLALVGDGGDAGPHRLRPGGTARGHDDPGKAVCPAWVCRGCVCRGCVCRGWVCRGSGTGLGLGERAARSRVRRAPLRRRKGARTLAQQLHLVGSGHHHDTVTRPGRGAERPVDHAAPAEGLQLLGPAEAAPLAGGHENGPDRRISLKHAASHAH